MIRNNSYMEREQFVKRIMELLNMSKADTINRWIVWAEECVDAGQYIDFQPAPREKAVSAWLYSYYTTLKSVQQKYGTDTAVKIVELADHRLCLYPYEMQRAADVFRNGGNYPQIQEMMLNGLLEDPLSHEKKTKNEWNR